MFTLTRIIPVIPGGILQPTSLDIVGSWVCPNGANSGIPLELRITSPNGAPTTVFTATTNNGSTGPVGSVTFSIPAWPGLQCGDKFAFEVRGNCGGTFTAWEAIGSEAINCQGCPRIDVHAPVYGACSGNPAVQDVTLSATVMLAPNQTETLVWEFGDGSTAPAGTVTNTTGNWNNPLTLSIAHSYADRSVAYQACLHGTNLECPRSCVDVKVTCSGNTCPVVIVTATVGNCDAASNREVTYAIGFNPPLPQGASATLVLAYGGNNANNQNTVVLNVNASNGPVASQTHVTHLPATGNPYSGSVTAVFSIPGAQCPASPVSVPVTPQACTPCPDNIAVQVTTPSGAGWCAPVQNLAASLAAQLSWPAGVVNTPVPSRYDWRVTLPDGRSATQQTPTATASTAIGWQGAGSVNGAIDLSDAGTYGIGVTVVFSTNAGLSLCNLTGSSSFALSRCPGGDGPCPTLGNLSVTVDCADPAASRSATLTASVTVQDPAGLAARFIWDFGDGSPPVVTTAPNATHTYGTPGTYTVRVRVQSRVPCNDAGPTEAVTSVTVQTCLCPPGQTRTDGGPCRPPPNEEGTGCFIARIAAAVLLALALLALLLGLCITSLAPGIFYVALGLAIAAVVVIILWLILCPTKACGWLLLLLAQVFLGVGWISTYFGTNCCSWLWIAGVGLLLLSGGLFAAWAYLCRPGPCQFLREVAIPLTAVVLPAIAYILLVPGVSACVNSIVAIIMSTDAGIITTSALACRGP
jgi:hypothetical protein